MNKFWTCWVKGTDGGYGHQHITFEEAVAEAKRLACLPGNIGKKVYILELRSCYIAEPHIICLM